MKKRVLVTAGIITAAVIVVLAGIPVKRWIDDQNMRYMYPPYIIYNGTGYKNVSGAVELDMQKEGYTETDTVITNLVDGDVRSEVDGTTNFAGYLNGTVYANDQRPGMIYLRLSGGEDDGKYACFCTAEEYP